MSFQVPWPPPYLYGLAWILLPAAIIALTAAGAEAGAIASPSGPIVALSPGPAGAGSVAGAGSRSRQALAALDGELELARLAPAHAPVDPPAAVALPRAHAQRGVATELAVDLQRQPPCGQQLLERADVGAPHRPLERPRAEAALGRSLGYRYCDAHGGHGHGERSTT